METPKHRLLIYRKHYHQLVNDLHIKQVSNIKTGVVPDRVYTDTLCYAIFMLCLFISISFNTYGLVNGNI